MTKPTITFKKFQRSSTNKFEFIVLADVMTIQSTRFETQFIYNQSSGKFTPIDKQFNKFLTSTDKIHFSMFAKMYFEEIKNK